MPSGVSRGPTTSEQQSSSLLPRRPPILLPQCLFHSAGQFFGSDGVSFHFARELLAVCLHNMPHESRKDAPGEAMARAVMGYQDMCASEALLPFLRLPGLEILSRTPCPG